MKNEFEEFDVNFKVVSNKNNEVYVEGFVTINDELGEDVDWFYYNGQGVPTPQMFVEHDGVDGFKGATEEQKWEVEQFRMDYGADAFWIDTCIIQSNENENRTYVRENCTLIINEGAKMECEIEEPATYRGDWIVEVIPKFNGDKIDLVTYMVETNEEFNPYDVDDFYFEIEDGHIYFEISKDYFEDDEIDSNMELINEEARRIFARSLTYELGIYAKYGEVMEQALDYSYDNEWLFKLSKIVGLSDDELDAFLREEGLMVN